MSAINDVIKMQKEGISEQDSVQRLKERGYSPYEIKQGLEQARIKNVVEERGQENNVTESMMQYPAASEAPSPVVNSPMEYGDEMQPSGFNLPQQLAEEQAPVADTTEEYIYPTAQPYPEQNYPDYNQFQQSSLNPEIITEISEQVSEEKIGKLRNELKEFSQFQISDEKKLIDLNERLEKIEKTIEKLQFAILGRIGSYVKNVEDIQREMEMMQTSFSKALIPLVEKAKEKTQKEGVKRKKSAKPQKSERRFQHSGIG